MIKKIGNEKFFDYAAMKNRVMDLLGKQLGLKIYPEYKKPMLNEHSQPKFYQVTDASIFATPQD